jgi:copper(I)-binding protein
VSRSRRGFTPASRLAAAVAVACLVPGVAACDAGDNAPTLQFHPQSAGIDAVVHGIRIDDAFVLGSASEASLPPGKSAGFYLALVNEGSPDRLVSVTAPGTAASVTLPAGGVALGTNQAAYLTGPKPKIVLTKLTRVLATGSTVRITLNFLNAGSYSLTVPVLSRSSDYATFSPVPVASPTVKTSKSATPGATNTATGPAVSTTDIPATPSTTPTGTAG